MILTVEPTARKRRYRSAMTPQGERGTIARQWRVNVAGVKGSLGVAGFTVWADTDSKLGQRLKANPLERELVMAHLPMHNAHEWVWF